MLVKKIAKLLLGKDSLIIRRFPTFSSLSHTIQLMDEFNQYHRSKQFESIQSQKLQNPFEGQFNQEGCKSHADKFPDIAKKHLQLNGNRKLEISSVGIGSYKGSLNEQDDLMMFNAVVDSILFGMNVIDTCSNFRGGRSEKCIGHALRYLFKHKNLKRNEIFISSKVGYVRQQLPAIQQHIINSHCVHPLYLQQSLNNSLDSLGIKALDVFYLNNFAECQMDSLGRDKFQKRLAQSFQFLEKARADKKIQYYGMASWEAFRTEPKHKGHLNLQNVKNIAQKVGGRGHGFRFIQVPINIMMPQAFAQKNQAGGSLLQTAELLKINVVSCSPLLNGSLINVPLPADRLNCRHNGAKHIQFIRSVPSPALVTTLIGQKRNRHVKKNVEVLSVPILDQAQWLQMIVPSETAPNVAEKDTEQD